MSKTGMVVETQLDQANIAYWDKVSNYLDELLDVVKEYEVDGEVSTENFDFVEDLDALQQDYGFEDSEMPLLWDYAEHGKDTDYGHIQGAGIAVVDGGERFILE